LKLIGNKNEFAVEYQITDNSNMMGYGKLWIQDKFYGSSQDLIYIGGYLGNLIENIANAKTLSLPIDYSNNDKIHEQLKNLSNETSEHLIRSSTFTDDFIGYKFRDGQYVVLVWKIRSDVEMLFDDLKDYTKSTVTVKVNHQIVEKVMNEFKEEIKKARA
jgi:hypothetical protein